MPPAAPLNICLIGQTFMGRAHSNAWLKAPRFFDGPEGNQPRMNADARR